MYKNRLLLCSESVIVDSQTGNISVINILEDIIPMGLPLFIPKLSILHYLDREKSDLENTVLHITIFLEQNKIFEVEHNVSFQGKLLARSVITLSGIPIQNPGNLKIIVKPKDTESMDFSISIRSPRNSTPIVLEQISK